MGEEKGRIVENNNINRLHSAENSQSPMPINTKH
jgi:hypothetical protein